MVGFFLPFRSSRSADRFLGGKRRKPKICFHPEKYIVISKHHFWKRPATWAPLLLFFFFSEWALLPSLPLSWPLNHLLSSQSLIWILLFLMLQGQTWEERPKRGKRGPPPIPFLFRRLWRVRLLRLLLRLDLSLRERKLETFFPKSSSFFREGPSPSLAVCLCVGFLLLLLTPQPNRGSGERGVGGA